MFCQHAAMANSQFALTAENAPAVAEICRRVDGLPLAIELAAARARFLSPAAVSAGLASALDLRAPAAGRPRRQQALRETIEWSHGLLGPELQRTLHALGVFAGGADMAAITAVVPPPASGDYLEGLIELADVNLVNVTEDSQGTPRFGLLQVVAEFAAERLAESGDLDGARTRHAEHFVALAEALTAELNSGRQAEVLAKLDLERDNLRAVLRWTLDAHDGTSRPERAELGLRLSSTMWDLWAVWRKEDLPESMHWYERALRLAPQRDSRERAIALVASSLLVADMGEQQAAVDQASAALAMGRRLQDARSTCLALFALAKRGAGEGSDAALPLLEEAERVAGDDVLARATGWTARIWYESAAGHFDKALEYGRRCAELAASKGDENTLTWTNLFMAEVLARKGSTDQALDQLGDCARAALRLGNRSMMIELLATAAMIAATRGEATRAAELVGANWAVVRETGGVILADEEEKWFLDTGLAQMRDRLGPVAWDAAVARGERLTAREALAFATSAAPMSVADAVD
jgi:tetratricopeptide (TPR) repeat protein